MVETVEAGGILVAILASLKAVEHAFMKFIGRQESIKKEESRQLLIQNNQKIGEMHKFMWKDMEKQTTLLESMERHLERIAKNGTGR